MKIRDDYAQRLAREIMLELGNYTNADNFLENCVKMRRFSPLSDMEMDDCPFADIYKAVDEGFRFVSGRSLTASDIPAINRAWDIIRSELVDFGRD